MTASSRVPRRWSRGFVLAAGMAFVALGAREVRAEHPLGKPYEDLLADEVKALVPVLRTALQGDHRRQVIYLARRILAADPKQAEGLAAVDRWKPEDALLGTAPEKAYVAHRDAVLKKLGAAYAALARQLTGEGKRPEDYFSVIERALAYGARDADLVDSLERAKQAWAGGWGTVPTAGRYAEVVPPLGTAITWLPEWDDDAWKGRAFQADAKAVRLNGWRIVTSVGPDDLWRLLGGLAAEEAYVVATFGSTYKAPHDAKREADEWMDLWLFGEVAAYDRAGNALIKSDTERPKFEGTSTWPEPGGRRGLALLRHRIDPWMGDDATWLGLAGRMLARRHMGPPGGWLSGRGTWILDGVQGAFEGFVPKGVTGGEVVPARCARLAAAKALRATSSLLPWDRLLDLDRTQADDVPRARAKFKFDGKDRDVERVDVVAAQATALVVAILRSEGGKGAKRLAGLLSETMKRDRMPDLDKTLGWPKGRAVQEAERFLDELKFE